MYSYYTMLSPPHSLRHLPISAFAVLQEENHLIAKFSY